MAGLKIYRILTFILLPFALYLLIDTLRGFQESIGNPFGLLLIFLLCCISVYIFSSSYFLFFGVFRAKSLKQNLKDLIKINASISTLFSVLMILSSMACLIVFSNKEFTVQILAQFEAQGGFVGTTKIHKLQMIQEMKIKSGIMLPISIMLLIHIVFTFKAIKLYGHVFDEA